MHNRLRVIALIAVFSCLACCVGLAQGKGDFYASAKEEYFLGELLATYSTDFGFSSEGRRYNVKKATSLVDGSIVKAGEIFSFNAVTGERTKENGYKESPIIERGKYIIGVGGGVCQVSTTLYNAVLRAGLRIERVSPHSLPVGYVPPSMDAMVSSATDFRFFNDTPFPITIKGSTNGNTLTFQIYGFRTITDGEEVKYRSCVTKVLSASYEELPDLGGELAEGEEYKTIKRAKDGLVSECYKEVYYQGNLVSNTLVRRDVYKAENGVRLVKAEDK